MATESTTETATASLRRAFEAFDTDKSGSLSVEDLKAILSRGKSPLTDADVQEIVDQFDENKDSVLQIDEVTPTTPHPVHSPSHCVTPATPHHA